MCRICRKFLELLSQLKKQFLKHGICKNLSEYGVAGEVFQSRSNIIFWTSLVLTSTLPRRGTATLPLCRVFLIQPPPLPPSEKRILIKYWRMPRGVLASRVCARKNPKFTSFATQPVCNAARAAHALRSDQYWRTPRGVLANMFAVI
jgi:hypothetical protein